MLTGVGALPAAGSCTSCLRVPRGAWRRPQAAAHSQHAEGINRLGSRCTLLQHRPQAACSRVQHHSSRAAVRCCSKQMAAKAAAPAEEEGAKPVKPAYNKYRSRADIERSYLRHWQEVTARGEQGQARMTVFSALAFLPVWAKFTLVPDFLRFAWWLVWVRVLVVAHVFHRAAVMQGAKLDAFLAARAGGPPSFDRKLVLLRYHHRISAWDSLRYRWALLQGKAQPSMQTPEEVQQIGDAQPTAG